MNGPDDPAPEQESGYQAVRYPYEDAPPAYSYADGFPSPAPSAPSAPSYPDDPYGEGAHRQGTAAEAAYPQAPYYDQAVSGAYGTHEPAARVDTYPLDGPDGEYPAYEAESASPGYVLPDVPESAWSFDARRSVRLGRILLACLLLVQAVLSLRLRGTAFEDEALYIASGHYELANVLHGTPVPVDFGAYFSGYPKFYPVLAAAVDSHFGLTGVRVVSLFFMLGTTALLYAMTRRMFNVRAALGAVALFCGLQSTLYLGNFATYDAAAIFLLALSAWLVVRTGRSNMAFVLLAALPAALACGVKYAAALYVPTLVVLAVLTAYRHRGWRSLIRGVLLGAAIAGLLGLGLELAGPIGGISGTTTDRAHGTDSAMRMLQDSANWGGLLFLTALGGSIAYGLRARMGEMPWIGNATPGPLRRVSLGVLLTGTALLAPAYQIHLGTEISLYKHVGFGLLFAAPMAGLGLARLVGPHFRNPQLGIILFVATLTFGMVQSHEEYSFPNSKPMVAYLRTVVNHKGIYLAEEQEVPAYYLRDVTGWTQWQTTFLMDYQAKDGKHYTGPAAFSAAVRDAHFDVIELHGGVTPDTDQAVIDALKGNPHYRLTAVIPYATSSGTSAFRIWVKQ